MSPGIFNEPSNRRGRLISESAAGAPAGAGESVCAMSSHSFDAPAPQARGY